MISITGDKAIDDVLRNLPLALTHQTLGIAHLAASRSLVDREHLLAPVGLTGNLADSIGAYRVSQKNATQVGEVRVGPQRKGGKKGFAGHLVEFGTKRRTTKRGANRGIMPAKPFARPAFEQTKGQVEKDIAVNIGRVVLRTMKRYIKG